MTLRVSLRLFTLIAWLAFGAAPANYQDVTFSKQQCRARNEAVKKGLDRDSDLFWAIESGSVGGGQTRTWMLMMNALHVKHAAATVDFSLAKGSLTLTVREIKVLNNYYDFSIESQVSDRLSATDRSSLYESLRLPFFQAGVESIRNLRIKTESCGTLYLNLLDDGCLPVLNPIPTVSSACGMAKGN